MPVVLALFYTMLVVLGASAGLVAVSTFFVYQSAEHALKKTFGPAMYASSCYLRDFSVYASFTAFFAAVYFIGSVTLTPKVTNIIILTGTLSAGYYLTFRTILLTLFSNRFNTILRTRYGIDQTLTFDGASARCHAGGVPAYVANHLNTQMNISNRVALPLGVVWAVFIFICISYLPASWIQGLTLSGLMALYAGVGLTLALLPEMDEDKPISSWKNSPVLSTSPAFVFMSMFTLMTPLCCNLTSSFSLF